MRLVIEIDPETNARTVTAETGGIVPAVVHDSVERMSRYLAVLRETHSGTDVDTLFFTYFAFTDD